MKISQQMRWTVLISIYLFFAGIASANDTFVYDNGHTAYPLNTDKIRMVSENISVQMKGEGIASRSAKVTCDFVFENTTNAEVKAKIGFPAQDQYYHDIGEGEKRYPPLRDFVSYVDGKAVPVNVRIQEQPYPVTYWYTWDVVFPPSRTIVLKNIYEVTLSLSYYNQWFTYILTTGANWKGPIGHSVIEVIYESANDLKKRVKSASPDEFKIQDNKIVWDFINFIPKNNIQVYEKNLDREGNFSDPTSRLLNGLIGHFKSKQYDGNSRFYNEQDMDIRKITGLMATVQSLKKEYTGNVTSEEQYINEVNLTYCRLLRNEIYAKRGRYFNSEYLRNFFMKVGGYNTKSDYSDASLNAFEKKNVDYIAAYEAKLAKQ